MASNGSGPSPAPDRCSRRSGSRNGGSVCHNGRATTPSTSGADLGMSDACAGPSSEPDEAGNGKTDRIRDVVELATSEDSKKKVDQVLFDVQQMTDLEKLLLYLRLPTGIKSEVDPLKQSFISSLGNRFEVTQTVTWIQTHLTEDHAVSMPKQEVYDGYCVYCQRMKMKALSTADFGKVMKQVFPTVRPRRLGTRGNSRYCYAGLKKKLLMDTPHLPDLNQSGEEELEESDVVDPKLSNAASHLVREWAEKLLEQKFVNMRELARHLVENSYVNNRSVAAFTLLSHLDVGDDAGKESQSSSMLGGSGSKHRETQLQLQRKLHEKELIREQKKKLLEQQRAQSASAEPKMTCGGAAGKSGRKSGALSARVLAAALTDAPVEIKREIVDRTDTPSASPRPGQQPNHGQRCAPYVRDAGPSPKPAKVAIPRVSSASNGGGVRFSPGAASIIIFPQLPGTGVKLPDYGGSPTKPKSKYKPIQPKPTEETARAAGETTSGEGNGCGGPHPIETLKGLPNPPSGTEQSESGGRKVRVTVVPRKSSKRVSETKEGAPSKRSRPPSRSALANVAASSSSSSSTAEVGVSTAVEQRDACASLPLCVPASALDGLQEMSITTIENDALNEYLNDQPTADQEEELLQYFGGGDDYETERRLQQPLPLQLPPQSHSTVNPAQQNQLSQLRRLLEQNFLGKAPTAPDDRFGQSQQQQQQLQSIEACSNKETSMPTLRLLLSDTKRLSSSGTDSFSDSPRAVGDPAHPSRCILSPTTGVVGALDDVAQQPDLVFGQHQHQHHHRLSSGVKSVGSGTDPKICSLDAESVAYLTEFSGDEVWSEFAAVKKVLPGSSEEMTLSSGDSSSGCPPTSFDLGRAAHGGSHHAHLVTIDEHQLRNVQMSIDADSVNGTAPLFPLHQHQHSRHASGNNGQSVPPSPNTRRRAFNFLPISPRDTPVQDGDVPYSSGGSGAAARNSSCAAATAGSSQPASNSNSPFVSPRSTPSSMCRSRHNSGQAAPATASSAFCTPRATPHPLYVTEPSSCMSSPFVSPHPTPVPFARSRHNSSQSAMVSRAGPNPLLAYTNMAASRSRHLSEFGTVLMSPGSAPMSPLEQQQQQQQQQHAVIGATESDSGLHHTSFPAGGMLDPPPPIRSRHNSTSGHPSTAPASPHSAPLSPLVTAHLGGSHDLYGHDHLFVKMGKGSPGAPPPLPPPPPPSVDELIVGGCERKSRMQSGGGTRRNSARSDQTAVGWSSSGISHRLASQLDPRLSARQRHASLGSAICGGGGAFVNASGRLAAIQQQQQHQQLLHHHQQQQQQTSEHPPAESVPPPPPPPLPPQLDHTSVASQSAFVAHRSQSVPLFQMIQNSIQQLEQSDPPTFNDVMISRSYPPTPIGQHAFTYEGAEHLKLTAPPSGGYLGGGDDSNRPPSFLSEGSGRPTDDNALDLPADQFHLPLDQFTYDDDITKFAAELEQFAAQQ